MELLNKLRGSKRKIILFLFDTVCVALINLVYYIVALEADNSIPVQNWKRYLYNAIVITAFIVFFRLILKAYSHIWRYTSTMAYFRLVIADGIATIAATIVTYVTHIYNGVWHFVIVSTLSALTALMARFSYRLIYKKRSSRVGGRDERVSIAIVGAGQLGVNLANELMSNCKAEYTPRFFIDLKPSKIGGQISGLPVYDETHAAKYLEKYGIRDVIIAISNIGGDDRAKLYELYCELGCSVKIYDTPFRVGVEDKNVQRVIRDFNIEDLLFRSPISVNDLESLSYFSGKTVLVTGGGGSIGSELCRQLAKCEPKKLIILDIYENNAYEIQQELIRKYRDKLDLAVEIASVRDLRRMEDVFRTYRPEVVFHAAAHKHVPLMETSNGEAVKNNVFGTYNTAELAEKYGVDKFVLVSTDKAVNPTNVMGASKRVCEMVIQCRTDSKTKFTAVRFGNVLGSNGSVVPLFKRQIAVGGPVTITDKRIIRYFMTIPEASQLLMQAGAMAQKGELFVLDMGKPVRIYDMAVNMIKLSGLEPGKDIEIREIGLRPGEKLYEELLMKTEHLDKTENNKIFIERDMPLTREQVDTKLDILREAVERFDNGDRDAVKNAIIEVVPTFHEPKEINDASAEAEEMKQTVLV